MAMIEEKTTNCVDPLIVVREPHAFPVITSSKNVVFLSLNALREFDALQRLLTLFATIMGSCVTLIF